MRLFIVKGGKVYAVKIETLAAGLGAFPDDLRARVYLYEIPPPHYVGVFESEAEARRFIDQAEARPMG